MAVQNAAINKNSRPYQEQLVASGRVNLILVLVLSVVNLVMLALDTQSYFLFSASVPYYLVWFGKCMDNNTLDGSGAIGAYASVALVIAAVILVVYLLCWLLSKKRPGWLVVSVVLFVIDTVALLYVAFVMMTEASAFILDIVLHGYVLFLMIRACLAVKKLKQMDPDDPEDTIAGTPELNP